MGALPRVPLITAPTRLHPVDGLAPRRVLVKRDDENSPVFGGCKTRALEFVLGAARAAGATAVLTSGTAGSNHVAATALHAGRLGFRVTALVLPQEPGALVARNLRLAAGAGARLEPVPDGVSVHPDRERHRAAVAELRERGERVHVIPFGGADPVAGVAHALAGLELAEQARGLPGPLRVHLPAASTLTAAGIAAGLALSGLPFQVTAVDVVGSSSTLGPGLLGRAREVAALLGGPADAVRPEHVRHVGYAGAPYGVPDPEAGRCADLLREAADVRVDECYGAKAFHHLLGEVGDADGTHLFWHTGSTREAGEVFGPVPPELLCYVE
ncbi:Pyridoxal-5'-phosphate-dependent protein beta subunit [Actinosynnema mirum DSM 43827]|uniref:Nocardicin C-9' epimerase n=2 Tax=Actinomycetes TaxID=1760 RepID=NOCJ_NOCUT|nr:RecName: Full=Nocardicin C-9' epimerase; AltName: Full=Nocardicin-A epimerase [Nocardia uniformis subsp. tsuyamanensis]AAT09799.1 NocJ [Nocardia uniformis subsp. tsuyamanensis]ACU38427.1 Pyridoxal-5'-phosphate-dependent protein beta subunit [Actinosynnema mirum DSM 43827]AXX31972.1 D-cysteine desulfhydrase [Actinosynnema pretiosum subsp. pretiosum]